MKPPYQMNSQETAREYQARAEKAEAEVARLRKTLSWIAWRCGDTLDSTVTPIRNAATNALRTTSVPTIDVSASPSDRGEWEKP